MNMRTIIRAIALSLLLSLVAFGARAQSLQATPFSLITAASTNSTLVTGTGQNVLKWVVTSNNTASTINYLKFYNKATAPTCGTDIPVLRIMLPGNTTGGGVTSVSFDDTRFTLGIGFCVTGGTGADADTSVGAAGLLINIGYVNQ